MDENDSLQNNEPSLSQRFGDRRRNSRWFKYLILILTIAVFIFGIIQGLAYFGSCCIVLAGASIATYVLLSGVDWLEDQINRYMANWRWLPQKLLHSILSHARLIATFTVLILFCLTVSFSIIGMWPSLSSQIRDLTETLPKYIHKLDMQILSFQHQSNEIIQENVSQYVESSTADRNTSLKKINIRQYFMAGSQGVKPMVSFSNVFKNLVPKAFQHLIEALTLTFENLLYAIASLVIIFYLLLDGRKLKLAFIDLLPIGIQQGVQDYLESTHQILSAFTKGQVIFAILVGIYLYILLQFLGLQFLGVLTLFAAATSILPVVGPWIGILPSVLICLFSNGVWDTLLLVTLYFGFYLFKDLFLYRYLVGKNIYVLSLKIHPVVVVFTFLVCVQMYGPVGVILSFPLASLISASIQYWGQHHRSESLPT